MPSGRADSSRENTEIQPEAHAERHFAFFSNVSDNLQVAIAYVVVLWSSNLSWQLSARRTSADCKRWVWSQKSDAF